MVGRLMDEKPKTEDAFQSLIPKVTRAAKTKFSAKLKHDGCGLPLKVCAANHPSGCWRAYIDNRGLLYKNMTIYDPRLGVERGCTADEAFWWLMNDPQSTFSENYNKAGARSFETFVMRYSAHAEKVGFFLDPPSIKKDVVDNSFDEKEWEHVIYDPNRKQDRSKPGSSNHNESIYRDSKINAPKHGVKSGVLKSSKKAAKMTDIIRWVFENMPLKDVDLDNCPSPAAFGLLQWARAEPDKFYSQFVVKLIPSQRELDNASKLNDDGEKALDLLERFLNDHS